MVTSENVVFNTQFKNFLFNEAVMFCSQDIQFLIL